MKRIPTRITPTTLALYLSELEHAHHWVVEKTNTRPDVISTVVAKLELDVDGQRPGVGLEIHDNGSCVIWAHLEVPS